MSSKLNTHYFQLLILTAILLILRSTTAAPIDDRVDWQEFLSRHDMVWDTALPTKWEESAFLGNGLLGAMIYQPSKPRGGQIFGWTYTRNESNSLRIDLSRRDIIDHRKGKRTLVDEGRLENGHFLLTPEGSITGGNMRLSLLNADTSGILITDRGQIEWRALITAERNLLIVEFTPSEGEENCHWEWVPAISEPTRLYKWDRGGHGKDRPQDKYPANPPAVREQRGDYTISCQPMLAGGDYCTVWKQMPAKQGVKRFYISLGYTTKNDMSSAVDAIAVIRRAEALSHDDLLNEHRQWWKDYYKQSFVSIPAPIIESLYWTQMYKLGAASRPGHPAMDLMGPWFQPSIWPGMWWNLNIQLAYYPVYTANRLQTGENFCRMLDDNLENLVENAATRRPLGFDPAQHGEGALVARVTGGHNLLGGMFKGQRGALELGNLLWGLHNYWRQCRYGADDARIREHFLPLLRRAVNIYLPMLKKDTDGTYHLPPTYSPEIGYGPDCNYDLALLDWGCKALVSECIRLGIEDPLLSKWQDVIENLAEFPTDENGYMIAKGAPLAKSHRHYSHLLMVYPLYLNNIEQPENRDLMLRSIDYWAGRQGAFAGYSYSGAASMYASIGRGDKAASFLKEMIKRYIHPNTMYTEAETPVIESPLSAAQSVNDMLLQSWSEWNGERLQFESTIRVFPAIPEAWKEAVFRDLRTEDAFLVSARRREGRTQWVVVQSLAGKPCRIRPNLGEEIQALNAAQEHQIHPLADDTFRLDLKSGETIVLIPASQPTPKIVIDPIIVPDGQYNYFGSRKMAARK